MSCLAILVLLIAVSRSEIVNTDCGRVNGSVTQTKDGQVFEFLQMPYAQPPINDLRWTHSKLLSRSSCASDGIYDATSDTRGKDQIKCVQFRKNMTEVDGTEDCLYLSVRTPSLEPNSSLPVLVWIHGGSLKTGYTDYSGYSTDAELTAELQMVTVNINYRLEIFGFLSSPDIWEDSENPGNFGNFGIGDAITALQWVQNNIANFGGNPSSVTILGESSGGTIVLGLLGSDKADGLFHKAISLSAPPIWRATPEYAYEANWKNLTTEVGCTQRSVRARRRCLKNTPVLDLIKTRNKDMEVRGEGFYDFPYSQGKVGESMDYNVLDRFIVNKGPFELLHHQRRQKVEVMIGNTAQETGTKAIDYNDNKVSTWREAEDLLSTKIDKFLSLTNRFHHSKWSMLHSIKFTYNFGRDSKDWWPQIFFDTLTTDVRTTCMNNELVNSLSWNRKIKPYRLYVKSRPNEIKCGTPWSAIHGWDTEALFGYGYYGPYMQQGTVSDPHQVQFEDNMRQLVKSFSYGRISDFWNSKNALVMENDYFPNSIHLTGPHDAPQESTCFMWKNLHMLQYGWQN